MVFNIKNENAKLKIKYNEIERALENEKEKYIKLDNELKYLKSQNNNSILNNFIKKKSNNYEKTNPQSYQKNNLDILRDSYNSNHNSGKKSFEKISKYNSHKTIKNKKPIFKYNNKNSFPPRNKPQEKFKSVVSKTTNCTENNIFENKFDIANTNENIKINLVSNNTEDAIEFVNEKIKNSGKITRIKSHKNIASLNLENINNEDNVKSIDDINKNFENTYSISDASEKANGKIKNKKIDFCSNCNYEIKEIKRITDKEEVISFDDIIKNSKRENGILEEQDLNKRFSFEENKNKENNIKLDTSDKSPFIYDSPQNNQSIKNSDININLINLSNFNSNKDSLKNLTLNNNNNFLTNANPNNSKNYNINNNDKKINNSKIKDIKDILNISNKNSNTNLHSLSSKLNNSSFILKKKYKEKYLKKFEKPLTSTLGVLLDIIELNISTKPINTARDSVLKTNPNYENASYSIDIYESSYNCEEEKRNILIDQIQSLIISKLRYMQKFSGVNLEKEIIKVKSWNGVLNKENNSILSNISNKKFIMLKRENKEKDISLTSCNLNKTLIFL